MVLKARTTRRPGRVAIALARDRPVSSAGSGRRSKSEEWHLEGYPGPSYWEQVESAIESIRQHCRRHRPAIDIVLLPPLVQLRNIDLPPLHSQVLIDKLTRDSARYFPARQGRLAIELHRTAVAGDEPRFIVTGAPETYVRKLRQIASGLGFRMSSLGGALQPWAAGIARERTPRRPRLRRPPVATNLPLTVRHDGLTYALLPGRTGVEAFCRGPGETAEQVETLLRRLPRRSESREVEESHSDPDPAEIDDDAGTIAPWRPLPERQLASDPAAAFSDVDAVALAADGALVSRRRAGFVTAGDLDLARRRALRRRRVMFAGTAVLAAGAVILHGVNLRSELQRIEARRAAVSSAVAEVASGLTEARAIESEILAIHTLDVERPHPSLAIADFTRSLPDDAWLTLLFIAPDSALLEGYADDAAAVYAALGNANAWRSRGLQGAVRREPDPTGTPKDHFLLVMQPVADSVGGKD